MAKLGSIFHPEANSPEHFTASARHMTETTRSTRRNALLKIALFFALVACVFSVLLTLKHL